MLASILENLSVLYHKRKEIEKASEAAERARKIREKHQKRRV
jgi:hypothetical protein